MALQRNKDEKDAFLVKTMNQNHHHSEACSAPPSTHKNELMIVDGYPALNPPLIHMTSIPNFLTFQNAISPPQTTGKGITNENWQKILSLDCQHAHTAKTKAESSSYSIGSTFFIPSDATPLCLLEEIALKIFRFHSRGAEGRYDPKNSGAEWWTLVMDGEDDEIGMHFDADYGLETFGDALLHPQIATVTYFSDVGVPTLILNKRSPQPPDDCVKALETTRGTFGGFLSHPRVGKHVAFDGRFLHGGPSDFFPPRSLKKEKEGQHKQKKRKLSSVRVSFLVNVWLNHIPIDSGRLPKETAEAMTPPSSASPSSNPVYSWNVNDNHQSDHIESISSLSTVPKDKTSVPVPAGRLRFLACSREIFLNFHASKRALKKMSYKAAEKLGGSAWIPLDGVMDIDVGRIVDSEEDDGDEDDDSSSSSGKESSLDDNSDESSILTEDEN